MITCYIIYANTHFPVIRVQLRLANIPADVPLSAFMSLVKVRKIKNPFVLTREHISCMTPSLLW